MCWCPSGAKFLHTRDPKNQNFLSSVNPTHRVHHCTCGLSMHKVYMIVSFEKSQKLMQTYADVDGGYLKGNSSIFKPRPYISMFGCVSDSHVKGFWDSSS